MEDIMDLSDALESKYFIDTKNIVVASDGGTIFLKLIDSDNAIQVLYIDKRINSSTYEHLYENNYPGEKDSIYYGKDAKLLNYTNIMFNKSYGV
jgi:hypothetical protein